MGTQDVVDGFEGSPVMWCHAQGRQARLVDGRAVTDVGFPAISGKLLRQCHHHPVACDLGNDRGSGDAGAAGVALDQSLCRARQVFGQSVAVDQGKVGWNGKRLNRPTHGKQAGLKDVDPVNLGHIDMSKPDNGRLLDFVKQPFSGVRGQFF